MLKAKDLAPGRVITELKRSYVHNGPSWGEATEYESGTVWMVIGFQERIKRRHNKSAAPREGWDVVLLSFGGQLDVKNFTESSMQFWKRLI